MTVLVVLVFAAQLCGAVVLARTLHAATLWWSVGPAVAASLAADLLLARCTDDSFQGLGRALGLGLVAVLLGQVARVPRTEVIAAVSAGCGTLLSTVPAATLIGLDGLPSGGRPAIAIAVAALIGGLPLPAAPLTGPLRVLGAGAAALVCAHSSLVEPADGAVVGVAAGAAALVAERALGPARSALMVSVLVGVTAGAIVGRGILG